MSGVRGMQALGQGLVQGADELYRAQKVEEEKVNTLRAEEAYTNLRERQLDLTMGEEKGFQRVKGSAAVSRPMLNEWGKMFEDAATEISGTLSNDEQRQAFKRRAGVARLQFKEEILRHQTRERDTYGKQVYDGALLTEQRNAVARWNSPNDIDMSLDRIRNTVEERAAEYDWPEEYKAGELRKEMGKVHAAVVQQALAEGDYLYAQRWYQENKDDIDLPTAKAVERAVDDGTQKQMQADLTAEFLRTRDDLGGLRELEKKILGDKDLDLTRKNSLLAMTMSRIGVLENRVAAEAHRQAQMVSQGLKQVNDATLKGFPVQPGQLEPFLAASRGNPALEEQVRAAERLAQATVAFSNARPMQQEATIAAMEAGIRADPSKVDVRVLDAFRTISQQQKERRDKNPYLYGVEQGLLEQPIPVNLAEPQKPGESAWADRIGFARFMQRDYGAPMKPLSEGEVEAVGQMLKKANPEQKRTWFGKLAQGVGDDHEGYAAIMAQIAPDNPVAAQAGLFAYRGRTEAADLMLAGQAILHPTRKDDGQPDKGKLWPMPADTDLRKAFQSYEQDAFSSRPQLRSGMYQSALSIYAAKSAQTGDASGVLDQGRWEESMRLATGGITNYRGRGLILPYGYTEGQFKESLGRRVEDMVEKKMFAEGVTREAVLDLPMRPIGDGRYVFEAGAGGVLVGPGKNAQPIVIDFNQGVPFRPSGSRREGALERQEPGPIQRPTPAGSSLFRQQK